MIKKMFNKKKYYLFCLVLSFLVLLFTTKSSFLYKFNDWVDANAFFTVGKSMVNGKVLYRDIFEQKGPILYFIYSIGYLISNKTFIGIFILEVFSFSIFLYYAHKIFNMFLESKYSLILLPILSFLITTFFSFVHGGSCEEFCLPFYAITLYYYFKHFKEKELSNKEIVLVGLLSGIIMMIKYTLLGLWIGFGLVLFYEQKSKKDYKKALSFCLYFLLGMSIPILIVLIYFAVNGAIKDFIDCYFVFNMKIYPTSKTAEDFKTAFSGEETNPIALMRYGNIELFLLLLMPIAINVIKDIRNKKLFRNGLIIIFIITITTIFWGFKLMAYYYTPILSFLIITLLCIIIYFKKYINLSRKNFIIVTIIINCLFIFLCYENANYKSMMKYKKEDYFQFKYADYINKHKNPTLLNMGYLDAGLYTTTGIVPNTRFFEVQNIEYKKYPDNLDEMRKNVENKNVDFILYYTPRDLEYIKKHDSYIFDNYKLVYDDPYLFQYKIKMNAYLFEKK